MMQDANNLQMVPINPGVQGPGYQINGPQINGNQHGLWCIDWNEINWSQLKTDLKSKWTLKRSWKTILLFFILLLVSVLDVTSDVCVAYKFLNGEKYVQRIQNQSDVSVKSNESRLISIMANLTLEERIDESLRYVLYIFQNYIFFSIEYFFAEIFINVSCFCQF